jgi:hypothetical protein
MLLIFGAKLRKISETTLLFHIFNNFVTLSHRCHTAAPAVGGSVHKNCTHRKYYTHHH